MRLAWRPPHLLLLDHARTDHLGDRRLHERRADRVTLTVSLVNVHNEGAIVTHLCLEVDDMVRQLGTGR